MKASESAEIDFDSFSEKSDKPTGGRPSVAVENTDFTRLSINGETPTGGKIKRTDYACIYDKGGR